jgi:hypothetical protein
VGSSEPLAEVFKSLGDSLGAVGTEHPSPLPGAF